MAVGTRLPRLSFIASQRTRSAVPHISLLRLEPTNRICSTRGLYRSSSCVCFWRFRRRFFFLDVVLCFLSSRPFPRVYRSVYFLRFFFLDVILCFFFLAELPSFPVLKFFPPPISHY
mmetsp:Transcript_26076/g.80246  ORF Transcript_26076/g.80246 Transcript_26076/m.80246 type:complete len:117 (+) Transcript_26076:193-543(+)